MPTLGFQKTLGLRLLVVEPRLVTAELDIADKHANSVGAVHGGVLMALADSLGAIGAVQNLADGQFTATLSSQTYFIAPASGTVLRASCSPLHLGRRTSIWRTDIRSGATGEERLVATVTQTQLHIEAER